MRKSQIYFRFSQKEDKVIILIDPISVITEEKERTVEKVAG
ncbi:MULTISPECIES: hypothetical protein [Thermoanaerobacter]|uniref:Uncharacterized protein n=1 Tax=Thermoanaerobacter brockii subsp. finnii (strain ATCC 43586 / DSM 3389 / AKO-1) TaxID=509193 RepID=E8UTZ3_THEBF|nr:MULTISPECIES: hypothetical protein [Thermoanaerobacter]ADV79980.1 hypothetical protein Thebr_1408 [Thermoanaerobacter brockii subsp. finnii Ako-1]